MGKDFKVSVHFLVFPQLRDYNICWGYALLSQILSKHYQCNVVLRAKATGRPPQYQADTLLAGVTFTLVAESSDSQSRY